MKFLIVLGVIAILVAMGLMIYLAPPIQNPPEILDTPIQNTPEDLVISPEILETPEKPNLLEGTIQNTTRNLGVTITP